MKKWIEKILNRFGYYNDNQLPERFKQIIKHKPSWNDPTINKLILNKITKENANEIEFEYDIGNYNMASLTKDAKEKIIAIIKEDEKSRTDYLAAMMDNLKTWEENE